MGKLEVVEEDEHEFQAEEDCAEVNPLTSEGANTFSGDSLFRRKRFDCAI